MSFILDALKKSESERQQQNTPGIASIPESGRPRPASKWVWIIGVLLAANLAAFGYIMLKPEPTNPPAAREQDISTELADAPAEVVAEPSMRPVQPAAVETSLPEAAESSPAAQTETTPAEPATGGIVPAPNPQPLPAISDGLPSFNELRLQGAMQLSDLHLDIHVYSVTPAERFVFINMSKYTENSVLAEGPTVLEITPYGVVLDYLGTPFLLPRE